MYVDDVRGVDRKGEGVMTHDTLNIMQGESFYVLTPPTHALFVVYLYKVSYNKLPRLVYFIYENSYKLNEATARLEFSFPYPFI